MAEQQKIPPLALPSPLPLAPSPQVEKHRHHLLASSGRYVAEQQKIADAAALQKQRQKAMDFVIHQLLPDKMLHMARICKGSARVSVRVGGGLLGGQKERQKAMDFVIHQLLPDKMLHTARICKGAARVSSLGGGAEEDP